MSQTSGGEIIEIGAPAGNEAKIFPPFRPVAYAGANHRHRILPCRSGTAACCLVASPVQAILCVIAPRDGIGRHRRIMIL
jgi:hypothetical protein